ncbi:MAG: right-handed parallel beta-helix repeat-containing protein [Spirochaetales bacterium]|nr:right-handed parallel beta-helix repeat-containing protein [Spirochaetales bacterium]
MKTRVCGLLLILCFLNIYAKDIYVREAANGTGTRTSPAGELWKVMERALRGDVIHVAEGSYYGKSGSGSFVVKVPYLTLVGGYDESFSKRDPFKHFTVLERSKDFKGDRLGLLEGILGGDTDHSHFIVDGFVLDGKSRNAYKTTGDLNPMGSFPGTLFHMKSPNIKIRNCILLNPYGEGIYCQWEGEENEVSNSFVLNTWYSGISTRSAQEKSVIKIKNCTIGFQWFQAGKGGGTAIFIGRMGEAILDNNLILFSQEYGINNSFANDNTMLFNTVFFQNWAGHYKFMDKDGKNLLVNDPGELDDLNRDYEFYSLWEAQGNRIVDPGLLPNKEYFDGFTHALASDPGRLDVPVINALRKQLGLAENAGKGTGVYGAAYPRDHVVPQLISKDAGVNPSGPFASYSSEIEDPEKISYTETPFEHFKRESNEVKGFKASAVEFMAKMGPGKMLWFEDIASKNDYRNVMLIAPWEKDEYTRDFIYGYILKGSLAEKNWDKYYDKKSRYNEGEGLRIKGKAFYLNSPSYTYPIAVIIQDVSSR